MASAAGPLPSPDGSRFVHIEIHDGLQDLLVGELAAATAAETRTRTAAQDATDRRGGLDRQPDQPVGRRLAAGRLAGRRRLGRGGRRDARRRRRTCGCFPSRASRPTTPGRARSPTRCRPSSARPCRPAASRRPSGSPSTARDGLRVEGNLWRPLTATGKRGGTRVPTIIYPHGGPTGQSFRSFQPFKQLLVAEGFAMLDVDFRGSTGYGRAFRLANHGEWGHADVEDLIDAARWAAEPAVVGRPAGDLRRVVRRLHGPVRAGRGARACGRPGSTCTATPRSPRATATATGWAASTCTR